MTFCANSKCLIAVCRLSDSTAALLPLCSASPGKSKRTSVITQLSNRYATFSNSPRRELMKAIRFHEFGGPEVLKYEDVPDPRPRKDQVLVRVKACALNHLDLFLRNGLPGVKLPHISGADVAGIVAEVGEYITDVKVGQRVLLAPHTFCGVCPACSRGEQNFCPQYSVLGYFNDGGNAEFISVPRVNVLPIQGELTYDEAAAVPLVFLTAWHMLVTRCAL